MDTEELPEKSRNRHTYTYAYIKAVQLRHASSKRRSIAPTHSTQYCSSLRDNPITIIFSLYGIRFGGVQKAYYIRECREKNIPLERPAGERC
jgi:hypothetical protein